jgi:hypothetical protein
MCCCGCRHTYDCAACRCRQEPRLRRGHTVGMPPPCLPWAAGQPLAPWPQASEQVCSCGTSAAAEALMHRHGKAWWARQQLGPHPTHAHEGMCCTASQLHHATCTPADPLSIAGRRKPLGVCTGITNPCCYSSTHAPMAPVMQVPTLPAAAPPPAPTRRQDLQQGLPQLP